MKNLTDHQTYLVRADEAHAEAQAATLDNVRERCLRAEAAWRQMAARAERNEKSRIERAAAKPEQQAEQQPG